MNKKTAMTSPRVVTSGPRPGGGQDLGSGPMGPDWVQSGKEQHRWAAYSSSAQLRCAGVLPSELKQHRGAVGNNSRGLGKVVNRTSDQRQPLAESNPHWKT